MSTGLLILTIVHVAISLVAIASGLAAGVGMVKSKICAKTTAIFLWTTVATSVTGFFFPIKAFTPALGFGIFSMMLLPIAIAALYKKKLAGKWRAAYVITAMLALYLNCFVLVVQSFMKAGGDFTNTKPPEGPIFGAVQGAVLLLFIVWTVLAVKKFRPVATPAAAAVQTALEPQVARR